MSHDAIQNAAAWAAEAFIERTQKVEDGTARVDEILPETRVSWSEVVSRFFEGRDDIISVRIEFQKAFDKEIKRRTNQ